MKSVLAFLVFTVTLTSAGNLHAQLFGQREMGSSRSPAARSQPPRSQGASRLQGADTSTEDVGSISGRERFFRGVREAGDFVGADSGDRGSFVGVQDIDSATLIESAMPDVPIDLGPETNVNQVQPPPPSMAMYSPRLQIGFQFARPNTRVVSSDLTHRLDLAFRGRAALQGGLGNRIEVSVEGETATVFGEVLCERDRTLAGMWLLFEPGISNVQNRLKVRTVEIPVELPAVEMRSDRPQ